MSLENENKRQADKIKAIEETNKMMEDEITDQSKRRKMLEEELKKFKEKYDNLQAETLLRAKRKQNVQSISLEDVANLTIFKNITKEANICRNLETKKQIMKLKQSPIFMQKAEDPAQKEAEEKGKLRRKGLGELTKLAIYDPFAVKQSEVNAVIIDNLLIEANKLEEAKGKNLLAHTQPQNLKLGELVLPPHQSKALLISQNHNQILGY